MLDVSIQAGGRDGRPAERGQGMQTEQPSPPANVAERYFGVVFDPQVYLRLVYLLVSFPLGLAYFVVLVTCLATFGGLAITIVGIPLLLATMYIWCGVADFDRWLANSLLGTAVPPLPFRESGQPWQWERIWARLTNLMTWRALVYLFARFPQGIGTFTFALFVLFVPVQLVTLPLTVWLSGDGTDAGLW